ncbi:hypothetical protein BD626DRAFT_569931 [Schizophyllum amplum]|uniref:Uncharacterized protein n=1 Tax=Schizophyllum amplum TaxID=97359 RepID=A0A550CBN1_9AGAR|nr:hypothetical protein BD626DRAFT_569931 [Auriculariopsis ampla]
MSLTINPSTPDGAYISAARKALNDPVAVNANWVRTIALNNNPRKTLADPRGPHYGVHANGQIAVGRFLGYAAFNNGELPAQLSAYGTGINEYGGPRGNVFDAGGIGRVRSALPFRAIKSTDVLPNGTPWPQDIIDDSQLAVRSIHRFNAQWNASQNINNAGDKTNGAFTVESPEFPDEWLPLVKSRPFFNVKAIQERANTMQPGDELLTPSQLRQAFARRHAHNMGIEDPVFLEDMNDPFRYYENTINALHARQSIFAVFPKYYDVHGQLSLPHNYAYDLDVGLPVVIDFNMQWLIPGQGGNPRSRTWHLIADEIRVLGPDGAYVDESDPFSSDDEHEQDVPETQSITAPIPDIHAPHVPVGNDHASSTPSSSITSVAVPLLPSQPSSPTPSTSASLLPAEPSSPTKRKPSDEKSAPSPPKKKKDRRGKAKAAPKGSTARNLDDPDVGESVGSAAGNVVGGGGAEDANHDDQGGVEDAMAVDL